MKCFLPSLVTILLATAAPMMTLTPQADKNAVHSLSGVILIDDMEIVEIVPVKDKSKSVIIRLTSETYVADAVSGKPASLINRKNDNVAAYYKPGKNGGEAIALIINIPEDYLPPVYAKVMCVIRNSGQLSVVTDTGIIVTINEGTPIEPFLTRGGASMDDVTENADLLLWNQALTTSIPARTTANKAVLLSNGKSESNEEE
ncbi:MAG: hypothetical protein LBB94_07460 [Clostridiales bacterium]|jgi:hypothetical protein|nr:hypothetical protein [Clostridiales bacterium]